METLPTPAACYKFPAHSVVSVRLLTATLDLSGKSYVVHYSCREITVNVMADSVNVENGSK